MMEIPALRKVNVSVPVTSEKILPGAFRQYGVFGNKL